MADSGDPRWWETLPPAETEIECGDGRHVIRWENGRLTLTAHGDADAELVLAALGGDKPRCVELAELWGRHHDDLDVLALGPRWDGDEIPVTWEDVEAARDEFRFPTGQPRSVPMRRGAAGPGPRSATPTEIRRAQSRHVELLALLALGPAFQLRLTASVAAAWPGKAAAGPGQPGPQPNAALTAALTGRVALAVESWLGIDAQLVTARPHDGPGWGEVELTEPSGQTWRRAGHGLRASLPVDWLARVWAPGLTLVRRYFVVAVLAASWPDARVLALTAPGADPVTLQVRATEGQHTGDRRTGDWGTPGASAHWEITDIGEGTVRT